MGIKVAIDDALLAEAQLLGKHKSKVETVHEALREFIQRRKQAKLIDLFGKIDFDPAYDYKRQRGHP